MRSPDELLPDRLARHAGTRPQATAFRFADRPGKATQLTWGELWAAATATAEAIQGRGHRRQRIGVACENASDFVTAIAAGILSGNAVVPFPVALSRRAAPRARSIAGAARPVAVLLSPGSDVPDWLADLAQQQGTDIVFVARPDAELTSPWSPPAIDPEDVCLVQFSSGSTDTPKGVGLSHRNVATNCMAIVETCGLTLESRQFCWLPLHHDMGLVGHVIAPFWGGFSSTLMNPLRFLARPLDWLRLMTQERTTLTSAPNFAFEICAKAADAQDLGDIDLSHLQVAINGGEPVTRGTVDRFIETFAPAGFAPSAMAPSYGLAEATLLVSCGRTAGGPRFLTVLPEGAGTHSGAGDERSSSVADLGPTVRGVGVRIVDAFGADAADGALGEIEISGPGVGRLIDSDGRLMPQAPLHTGDLGFVKDGRLQVVGRSKDLIIIRGQNVHPSDVEAAALEAHRAIVPGGLAAIGIERDGTQALIVLAEVQRRRLSGPEETAGLRRGISERVARGVGHVPAEVVILQPGELPRTSSGKVRRFEAAALWRAGSLADTKVTHPLASETV